MGWERRHWPSSATDSPRSGRTESASAKTGQRDNGFDADVTLTTGELSRPVVEPIDVPGGELERDAGPPGTPASPSLEPLAA